MAHCLSTQGVHLIELPIDYSVTDELQVPPPFLISFFFMRVVAFL